MYVVYTHCGNFTAECQFSVVECEDNIMIVLRMTFFFSLLVTVALYSVPALLETYGLPTWQSHFTWALGWALFVVAVFFIGLLRAPDREGHGHAPLALLLGMIVGMAINASVLQSLGENVF